MADAVSSGAFEEQLCEEREECKIWIGNLDKNVTEFQLLQILKRIGSIKGFEFLFHMHGPFKGEPRGYCFIEFETKEDSDNAIKSLNGKQLLSKKLIVDYAKKRSQSDDQRSCSRKDKKNDEFDKNLTRRKQIQALEEKLSLMEKGIETTNMNTKGENYRTDNHRTRTKTHPYFQRQKRCDRK